MSRLEFNLTNLEQRASNPDGTEGEGLSHKTGGIGGAGMVLVQVLELAPPIALLRDGEPQGAAILVHDIGDHGARYEGLAEALSKAGLIVSLPDLRGHGRSEGPRGHVPGLSEPVRDLHAVREHVAYRMPGAKSIVIGMGAGALFAVAYAKEHADEVHGVVLVAPLLEPHFGPPQKAGGLIGMFKKLGPLSPCAIGWSADQQCADASAAAAWEADAQRGATLTSRASDVLKAAAATTRKTQLDQPVLVIAGADDPISPAAAAEAFAKEIGAEFVVFPGQRHDLLHDSGHADVIQKVVTQAAAWVGATS